MTEAIEDISDPRLWKKDGWIARVIKNENDDGWAVEMSRPGDSDPALVTPWTMGRDKKNPKPLDHSSFHTLVKTVTEVLRRHEHALRERLHKTFTYDATDGRRVRMELDIVPDEDDPHAKLVAYDDTTNEIIRSGQTSPTFKLSAKTAQRFVSTGEA